MARLVAQVKISFFAWALLALQLGACEAVPSPANIYDPPPRLGVQTAVPESQSAVAVAQVPQNTFPAEEKHHAPHIPIEKMNALLTLPDLPSPRVILIEPEQQEFLVKLGDRVGKEAAMVTTISKDAVTLSVLRWDKSKKVEVKHLKLRVDGSPAELLNVLFPGNENQGKNEDQSVPFP